MQPFFLLWLLGSAMGSGKAGVSRLSYFEVAYQPQPRRWPAFLASLCLHVVLLVALPALLGSIDTIDQPAYWAYRLQWDRTLRIRIPERLYLASGGRRTPAPRRRAGAGQAAASASRSGNVASVGGSKPPAGSGPRRRFELPPLARRPRHPHILLQPELPLDLPLPASARLPELFFWAPKPPPPFRAKVMVVPGYVRAPGATFRLDTPPGLELPTEGAGLSLLAPPALGEREQAAFAAASRLPLRIPGPPPSTELRSTTTESSSGDPLAVLSLSALPRPMQEILLVPPATQLGTIPRGAEGAGAPKPGSPPGAKGAQQPEAASASPPGQPAGEGLVALNRPVVAAPLPTPAAPESPLPPEEPAAPAVTARAARSALLAEDTRLEHPATGVFDVVVQSAEADGFPESAGVLSGRPVYSVYLNVGGPKEWVLQYCVPAGGGQTAEVSGGVVRLSSPSPLVAPYPRVTFRPSIKKRPGVPYVIVHGLLGTNGRLEDLRVVGTHGAEDGPFLLPVLQQWEFRPATQDGRPVRIEIVLAIPAE